MRNLFFLLMVFSHFLVFQSLAASVECRGTIVSSTGIKSGVDLYFDIDPLNYNGKSSDLRIYVYGDDETFTGNLKFEKKGTQIMAKGSTIAQSTKEVIVNAELEIDKKAIESGATKFKASAFFEAINYKDDSRQVIEIVYKYENVVLDCKTTN